MFRQSIAKTTPALKSATVVQSRSFAKVTLVGRLGADPVEKHTADEKAYWLYRLAVARPPKKDAKGELVRDESGNPIREADWFSVFNFRENAKDAMPSYHSGDLVLVEGKSLLLLSAPSEADPIANMSTRPISDDRTETILNHSSIKVLDRPKKAE